MSLKLDKAKKTINNWLNALSNVSSQFASATLRIELFRGLVTRPNRVDAGWLLRNIAATP